MRRERHVFLGLADPEHLLVFAKISVAAEALLDDLAGAHTEGPAGVGLLVHAARDTRDVFGGRVVWEGGVCCVGRALRGVGVGCPFFEEGEDFDLCPRHVERVVGSDDCAVARAIYGGCEDSEGGAYVGADYGCACQGGFAESER